MTRSILSTLLLLTMAPAAFCKPHEVIEEDHAVTTRHNGRTLWTYHHNPVEGKPYFHPVCSTDGIAFTDLRPKDHPWHRAVWFSWKTINAVNYWEEAPETGRSAGETRVARIKRQVSDSGAVQFELDIDYAAAHGDSVVMEEQRRLLVSPPGKAGVYTIDWSATFQALENDVTLDRTPPANQPNGQPWGGYAGWSVRMNKGVMGGIFVNSRGAENADRQPAAWMLFKAPQGGSLLFMDHPQNLNYPAKWYLAPNMPYFSPAVIHDARHTIKAGQTLSLRYRLVVAPGSMTSDHARKAWSAWTGVRE